jgi:hypothetical protein
MADQRAAQTEADRKAARKIPPLVWIVIAILVGWLVIALIQRGGTHTTPHGGTMPEAAEGPAIMPAAPARSGAPATPAGVINGPTQPPQ